MLGDRICNVNVSVIPVSDAECLRQSLDGFGVELDGLGKRAGLEVHITLLPGLFRQVRVNICLLLRIRLGFLGLVPESASAFAQRTWQ